MAVRRLLIRPGGIGDCILSLPALRYLRADYTEVWVRSEVVPLVRFADCVRSIASSGIDLLGLAGVAPPASIVDQLRSFDDIVSWYGSNRPDFREHVAGLGLAFRFLEALPSPGEEIHAADFYLKQAGCRGAAVPRIDCPAAAGGAYVVIHPFSGSPRKNWPLDQYRELARRIAIPVRWCAGPGEQIERAVRIADLYELACWIHSACLYVGNDSGITHLAAATGVPVVALFGPTDPKVWGPRGARVRIVSGKLDEITVDEVLAAAAMVTT